MAQALGILSNPDLEQEDAQAPLPTISPAPVPEGTLPTIRSAPQQQAPVFRADPFRQQQEQRLMSAIRQQEQPSAKPQGFWPKAGHILGNIGDALGEVILGDQNMRDISGTRQHAGAVNEATEKELQGLEKQDTVDENQAGLNAEREATTEATREKTAEEPALTQSEINERNAQASALLNPQAKTDFEAWQKQNPGKPVEEWLKAQKANAPGNDFEQYYKDFLTEGNLPDSAHNRTMARREWAAASQAPQRAPIVNVLVPDGKGGYVDQGVHPGSTVAPGAVTPSGMNTMNTPTAQTRNMADMAQTVLPQMNSVNQEVDQLAQSIGPAIGRWNELLTNKGGTDYPQFAKLDTDLDLLASAIVRTHFGSRGGQQYREELKKMFGEAQSPDDLKARIAGANGWLQGYAHMADRNDGNQDEAPPIVQHSPSTGQYRYSVDGGKTWQPGQPKTQ
jgi:hypothetical protein